MLTIRVGTALIVLTVVAVAGAGELPPPAIAPIAHYPLQTDGLDATGINDPMILVNAPFQDGGVYCNGIYSNDPGGCTVSTPSLATLNFDSFALSCEFRIDQYVPGVLNPILIGGYGYRWIGAEVTPNGNLAFLCNNSDYQVSSQVVTLDVWHELVLTYDAATHIGKLFLDRRLVGTQEFVLIQGDDRDVSSTNYGGGRTLRGLIREIVVYDAAFDPTLAEVSTWGSMKALFR